MGSFTSTKKIGPISTCHRNWMAATNSNRDSVKCSLIHGYSRWVQFTFSGELDRHQWVQDFGDCKFMKQFIESNWDHRVLVGSNDPQIELLKELHDLSVIDLNIIDASRGWGPGIEGSCLHLFDNLQPELTRRTDGRVRIVKIEIWEHDFNTACFIPSDEDFDRVNQI